MKCLTEELFSNFSFKIERLQMFIYWYEPIGGGGGGGSVILVRHNLSIIPPAEHNF